MPEITLKVCQGCGAQGLPGVLDFPHYRDCPVWANERQLAVDAAIHGVSFRGSNGERIDPARISQDPSGGSE